MAVPRSLRYISVAALLAGVAMIFLGALRMGVTWDEPFHVEKFNNYLQTGWYLNNGQVIDGEPVASMTQQFVYAPVTMLLLHGLGVVTGVEDPGSASFTADAYTVRHLGIGLISLLGLLAVAATARLLFRRWDWALVATSVLAVLPMWTGQAMFNLKDVPVATGYSLATLGLVIIGRRSRDRDWWRRVTGPAALAAGVVLAVGTRPGMWTGIAASTVALLGCCLLRPDAGSAGQRLRQDLWRFRDVAVALAIAALALWLVEPNVFGSPLHALERSTFSSANFLSSRSKRTYVPVRVFLQVPLIMLGFAIVGVFVASRRLIRLRLRLDVFHTRLVVVLVQLFALPLVAIVHGASLYGDLRQLLFAAPAMALLTTFGIRHVFLLAGRGTDRRGPPMVAGLACVALIAPALDQATLFPYNYAYYNPLADVAQVRTSGEYYRGSGRELAPSIPATGRIVCSPQGDDDGRAMRMAHLDGWVDCATALSSPISAYLPSRSRDGDQLADDQFWAITFDPEGDVTSNCEPITSVSRGVGWRRVHLAALSLCRRPFPVLSKEPITFESGEPSGLDYPDLGWLIPGNDGTLVGVRSRGGASTMTFQLDSTFRGNDVRLRLRTTLGDVPLVSFGGEELPVQRASGSNLEIVVPSGLVERAIRTPLTLEFRSPTESPLDLKVFTMRAEAVGP